MALSRTFLIALVVGTLMIITFIWIYYLYRRRRLLQMRRGASATPAPITTVTLHTTSIPGTGQQTSFPTAPPQTFRGPTNTSALSDGPPSYLQAVNTAPGTQPPSYEDVVRY